MLRSCPDSRLLRRLRREQRGFALILALGAMIALGITVTAVIEYTSSNTRASSISAAQQDANHAAEAALLAAYSKLSYVNWTTGTGNDATSPTLLGCAAGSGGSSDCTTTAPSLTCVNALTTCASSTTSGQAGTGTYYGSYDALSLTWTIYAAGYARNPTNAQVIKKTYTATSTLFWDTNTPPNVAVWNHLYSTSPQTSASCELDVSGQNVVVDVPVYVTGDMCLSGNGAHVAEDTANGGQPVDLKVLGKLVFSGNGSYVGYNASNPGSAITSGVVNLGCTTTTSGTGQTCAYPTFDYHVNSTDAVQTLVSPTPDYTWYDNADPGPMHTCKTGTSPSPPSSGNPFDNNTTRDDGATTFNLTPATAYTCLSQSGTGYLTWTPGTSGGLGSLAVNGVVFFDGAVQLTQSAVYTGKGTIYASGPFSFPYQNTYICANATCDFNTWDPNTTMLMLASLYPSSNSTRSNPDAAFSFVGNQDKFQGSVFTTPTGLVNFAGQSIQVEGPIVGGKFSFGNNVSLKPLPTITKLPPGAPLAVNAHATPGRLSYTSGN